MRREVEHFYLRQNARNRKTSYYELPIVDGHGRERWIGLNAQVLAGENELVGFQAIARDITERKRMESESAKIHSFRETRLAATTPGILYVFDLVERKTIFANREITTVLGHTSPKTAAISTSSPCGCSTLTTSPRCGCITTLLRRARDGEVQAHRVPGAPCRWQLGLAIIASGDAVRTG